MPTALWLIRSGLAAVLGLARRKHARVEKVSLWSEPAVRRGRKLRILKAGLASVTS